MIRASIYTAMVLIGLCMIVPTPAFAVFSRPFGGRIITAPVPGVECYNPPKQGSPFIISSGIESYEGDTNTKSFGQIVPSAWILGLYSITPSTNCYIPATPANIPYPTFRTILHGTSVR
jgi:hypothetical protein